MDKLIVLATASYSQESGLFGDEDCADRSNFGGAFNMQFPVSHFCKTVLQVINTYVAAVGTTGSIVMTPIKDNVMNDAYISPLFRLSERRILNRMYMICLL